MCSLWEQREREGEWGGLSEGEQPSSNRISSLTKLEGEPPGIC